MKPLDGVKVIELLGLAPGPFCGMVLADFGAEVIKVERPDAMFLSSTNVLSRGKRSIVIDLKKAEGVAVLKQLLSTADVLIDPYRPGVMEKFGLGPEQVMQENPRLIYSRLSGFGQDGPYATHAGHDMNFVAMSGLLSLMGKPTENPFPPPFLVGDFAGGALICTIGILLALIERAHSNRGQVIDAAIVDGLNYFGSMIFNLHEKGKIKETRGTNFLDGNVPYYNTYKTRDNKFMAVAPLEPKFFSNCVKGLGLDEKKIPSQKDHSRWNELSDIFAATIATKTQQEWTDIFAGIDACVTPVLSLSQLKAFPHHRERDLFFENNEGEAEPAPAPKLQRNPGVASLKRPETGQHTREILLECGLGEDDISRLIAQGVVLELKSS